MKKRIKINQVIRNTLKRLRHQFSWQRGVKASRAWMSPLIAIYGALAGKVTPTVPIGLISFLGALSKISSSQGVMGLAQYLKACHIYMMKYLAGDTILDSKAFGPVVGRTRCGLPTIIPAA